MEYVQGVFLLVVLFGGEGEFCAPVFFTAPEYQVQYSHGCRLSFETIKNIMKQMTSETKNLQMYSTEVTGHSPGKSPSTGRCCFIFTDLDIERSGCHAHGRVQ